MGLTPPVLYVTPSADQEPSSNQTGTGGGTPATRGGHSPSASLDSTNGNTNYYPPSPTLSTGSHHNNNNTLHSSAKISTPTSPRIKGHSPTKSEDSHFYQFLEESARKQRARGDTVNSTSVGGGAASSGTGSTNGGHQRRPSATSGVSGFTASDGTHLKEVDNAGPTSQHKNGDLEAGPISGKQEVDNAQADSDEPKKVKTGFLAKIPFLKRFAKEQDEPKKIILQDPTPQEMGVFGPMVPSALNALLDPKSLPNLQAMGGDKGLVEKLFSNAETGLSEKDLQAGATIEDRKRIYGENKLPQRKSKSLLQLMWIAYQDKLLVSCILMLLLFVL